MHGKHGVKQSLRMSYDERDPGGVLFLILVQQLTVLLFCRLSN